MVARRARSSSAAAGSGAAMAKVWQHPYLNVFKHFKVEEWKRSTKEGDVTTLMVTSEGLDLSWVVKMEGDKTLKGTVYRISGAVPASNYLQLPKTSTQSLGLTGHYLYILFKPIPARYFVVHLDVTTEDSRVIRISFSNLFKEFKSTATWLQFPFICGAAKGTVYESTAKASKRDLVGLAPSNVRWTFLALDLRYILSLYLNRSFSHLKGIKLCSNLLVKNLFTSDLVFDPAMTFSEAHQSKLTLHGISPIPREMAFPVPKGETWHELYDYVRFPSDGSKMPFDSIQKGTLNPAAVVHAEDDPVGQVPEEVSLSKPVRDRVSLIQQITSPKEMPRQSPLLTQRIPRNHRAASEPLQPSDTLGHTCWGEGLQARGDSCLPGPPVHDDSIHVYAHRNGDVTVHAISVDSDESGYAQMPRPRVISAKNSARSTIGLQRLLPDPILRLKKIIGFGGCSTRWALWAADGSEVVYPCHALIVAIKLDSGKQRFFAGHTDKACCDDFAKHFMEKIAQIHHELGSTSDPEASAEIPMLPSGPKLMDEFQLLRPDDVDKVLGREAVVRPVMKKASLDPEMATNYRPVANIPFLGKVLERVVAGQLQALLDETDYLDPFQSGFRPGYGTESALVTLYDDLCRERDRGSASLLVLLDLSAAFNTIDHGILLDRLARLGVGGTALQWFCSYLNGRFQKVMLGDYGSAPWQLCHGVPQGSFLSPLLFNVYMKPLGGVIRRCGLQNHQYADDTQPCLSFSTNPGEAVAVLNRCLAEVMGWMRANELKLNPDKTEVLVVGGSDFGEGDLDLVLNGVALPLRLGVLLDPELSLKAQVTAVARSAFFQLRLIYELRPYLENDCLATVTHALVTSRLDFCNTLYMGLPLKTVQILQLVQNRTARLLTGTGHYVHMTPVLRQLHWLPIEVRAQFKVLVMTYKALNGLGPGYLKERLRPYVPVCPLRSVGEALLREPSVKEIRRVVALAFNGNCTLLASVQVGQLSMMRLWDFPAGKFLCMFKAGMHSVSCLSFSYSGSVLCGTGKDSHGKTVVVVWSTLQAHHGGEVVALAKAHTDVDIQTMKIAFFDDTRMVSCGRDNVRLWRVRSGVLRSCPVNLGEYRSLEFTDLAFEAGHSSQREPEDRTLFVCSRSGHVLEIDYKNITVKNARRLLPSEVKHSHQQEKQTFNSGPGIALNSISLSSSFCATASEDGYVRLWPLDFSEVFLEAEHDYPVSSVRISPDNLKVLCTTATGNVGCLDIQSRDYCTIMRSHMDSVLAFSVERSQKQLATVSQDNTIRIWNLESMQQLYEFTASDETPCAVAFHPSQHIFACGFGSGVVRTISLAASALLEEHKQHRGSITGLTFSPDGNFMYSSCTHGTLALYNCAIQKSHTVRVLANVVSQDADHAPDALSVSCDGRLLAFVGPSKYIVTLMDAPTLDELLRIDVSILDLDSTALDVAERVCFAPFPLGHCLVTTSSQKILVLDAKSGRLIRMVSHVHKQSCSSLALSPDARYLLTAGDRVIKVWDYEMRFDISSQVFIGHSEPVQQVRFTPDQKQVISVGDAIFLWDFLGVFAEESSKDEIDSAESLNSPKAVRHPGCRTALAFVLLFIPALFTEAILQELHNLTPGANDAPRQLVPVPSVVSPPCLDLSSIPRMADEDIFSESEEEKESSPKGCSGEVANGDKGCSLKEVHGEELPVQRPKAIQPSSRSCSHAGNEHRKETQSSQPQDLIRPDCYRHFTPRFKTSAPHKAFCSPLAANENLKLKTVIGYNGNGRGNMVWNPDTGFFAYSCGCVLIVEDLHSGSQQHWLGHPEEISTLALSHDAQGLASASGQGRRDARCQIRIWDVQSGTCQKVLFHHETQVQAMAYSRDDRFLVTLGDYVDRIIALWSAHTYDLMSSTRLSEPVHEVAFSPLSVGHLTCVGKGAVTFWLMEQQGADISLKVHRVPVPDAVGPVELTSLCYSAGCLLYIGTSAGQICAWDMEVSRCFMTWEATEGEIGVLKCHTNRLVSGSNTKKIQLWSVAAVQELRVKGSSASSSSVLLEQEMTLDGTIVSAAFDDCMDMGIVGTTAGTLWYINWVDSTSIRLISGHKNKVHDVAFSPGESHCATCGEDGSVRVWSLASMELVVQFQVLNQSCICLAWSPSPSSVSGAESRHIVAGYSDGTMRVFSISRTEMELKMHPHSVAVTALGYSADGEIILSGGKDGLMAVSSPRTGMTVRVLADHRSSPISVIHCTRKQASHQFQGEQAEETQFPQSRLIRHPLQNTKVMHKYLKGVETGKDPLKYSAAVLGISSYKCIRYQHTELGVEGGDLWLAASADRRVSVWVSDWRKDKCELIDWLSFPAPTGPEVSGPLPPSLAAFCPWNKNMIVYVGFGLQKEILFYSLQQKQVVEKIPLPYFASSLSLSPAACAIAVGFSERVLRLIDHAVKTGQDYVGHDDAVCLCRFTPSGKRLFTASYNEIFVWEVQNR
ncbi:WD repeat-containing protein 90 [Varanus komodoensis]|nr:WD repeat-containing protein 90 [Varanus komodoensis]